MLKAALLATTTTTTTTTNTMSLQRFLHINTQEFSSLINLKSEHVTFTMDFLDITSALGLKQNTYWSSGVTEVLVITSTINPSPASKYATTATFSQIAPQILSTMNLTSDTEYEYVKPSISTSYRLQTNSSVIPTATSTTIIWKQPFTIPYIPTESSTNLTETNERETSENSVIILDLVNMTIAIDLAVSIDLSFFQELEDPSSAEYWTFVNEFETALTFAFGTNPAFVGICHRHFRNGSIVFSFELLLKGDTILKEAADEFDKNLNNLKNGTIFSIQIQFNVTEMKQAYSQVSVQQAAGNVCEVYRDITYCGQGYRCRSIPGSRISCELDCSSLPVNCKSNGGTCAFDHISNTTFCRCSFEKGVSVSGDACEIRTEQAESMSTGDIYGIAFGAIGVVGVLIAIPSSILAIRKCRRTVSCTGIFQGIRKVFGKRLSYTVYNPTIQP